MANELSVQPAGESSADLLHSPFRRHAWWIALLAPAIVGPWWAIAMTTARGGHAVFTWTGAILALLVLACAYTDIRWKRIPNWATYTAVLWALLLNGAHAAGASFEGAGQIGLTRCLLGAGACFTVMFMIYQTVGGGAGDVKLAAAIGALLGLQAGVAVVLWCYVAAGLGILAWLIWRSGAWYTARLLLKQFVRFFCPLAVGAPDDEEKRVLRHPIPLAGFFAIGVLIVLLQQA